MTKPTRTLSRDLGVLRRSLRGTEESLVSNRDLGVVVGYLMFNMACAAPLMMPGVSTGMQILLGAGILGAFLIISRLTIKRLRSLGEFEQLILYRSLATGGLIAVWVVLALGVVAVAIGNPNLFLVIALGPPQLWLCTALFSRTAEDAYRNADSAP